MHSLDDVAARLDKVRWSGRDTFTACCPVHPDRSPSLSVSVAEDGTVLACCHAGCPQSEVARALDLRSGSTRPDLQVVRPQQKPQTFDYALSLWNASTGGIASHPYAQKKRITHDFGARRGAVNGRLVGKGADCILLPNRDWDGSVIGVEAINGEGQKQTFGSKGLLVLGHPEGADLIHVVEGWASAWAAGHLFPRPFAAVVTFGKGRLKQTAIEAGKRFPGGHVLVHTEGDDNRDIWDLWVAGDADQYVKRGLRVANKNDKQRA